MGIPDTGQSVARALYTAARAGGPDVVALDEDVASGLAAACDDLVAELGRIAERGQGLETVRGFPALPTGAGLARGFGAKGQEFLATVTAFQQTALFYKAAYLAAGRRFADAEAAVSAAFALAGGRS